MNQFIDTSELDFINYRETLKTFLKNQTQFQDYNFEGSNLSVLLDLLAYNRTVGAYYENMIGNEAFIDTALLKNSVTSIAKALNYTPKSRTSARATVTFNIDTGTAKPSSITIPKWYKVTANGYNSNNVPTTYSFVTNSNIIVQPDSFFNYTASDVEIYQGDVVKEVFIANTNKQYILQSNTVDIDSIYVEITDDSNTTTAWSRANTLYGLNGLSNVFFIESYLDDKYQLSFGNGSIGRNVQNGYSIAVTYLSTEGSDGNGITNFYPSVQVEGYEVTSIVATSPSTNGAERESIETIRFQAPKYFQTQERAVIESDYETFVRENYSTVQAVMAYGGEKLNPPQYGKVAIFIKPYGDFGVISDTLKTKISTDLKSKNLISNPVIIDADYFYTNLKSTIYYDSSKLTISLDDLKTKIVSNIKTYSDSVLVNFDSDFRSSKLLSYIDTIDTAIVSNDTSLQFIRRWNPVTGAQVSYGFSFGTELYKYNITSPLSSGLQATVYSSPFSYNINGTIYSCIIKDNGLGSLNLVVNNSDQTLVKSNIGSINYDTGDFSVTLSISGYSEYISVYAIPRIKDLIVNENRFLLVDTSDIVVEMVPYVY